MRRPCRASRIPPKCKGVFFGDAAHAFSAVCKDERRKRFRVIGRNKKKDQALKEQDIDSWSAFRDCFTAAGEEALEFLNGPPGMAVAAVPTEELHFLSVPTAPGLWSKSLERPSGDDVPGGVDDPRGPRGPCAGSHLGVNTI